MNRHSWAARGAFSEVLGHSQTAAHQSCSECMASLGHAVVTCFRTWMETERGSGWGLCTSLLPHGLPCVVSWGATQEDSGCGAGGVPLGGTCTSEGSKWRPASRGENGSWRWGEKPAVPVSTCKPRAEQCLGCREGGQPEGMVLQQSLAILSTSTLESLNWLSANIGGPDPEPFLFAGPESAGPEQPQRDQVLFVL